MNNYYLNEEKRKFYDEALELIRNCTSNFWNLDEGVDEFIDAINMNKNVRTMLSYKGENKHGHGKTSYLKFCFTKELENEIVNFILPQMKRK